MATVCTDDNYLEVFEHDRKKRIVTFEIFRSLLKNLYIGD